MSSEGLRGPDPALANSLLFGKSLRHIPSLCQSPHKTRHSCKPCAGPVLRCEGEEEEGCRDGQCSDQSHWPDWEAEALHQAGLISVARLDVGDRELPASRQHLRCPSFPSLPSTFPKPAVSLQLWFKVCFLWGFGHFPGLLFTHQSLSGEQSFRGTTKGQKKFRVQSLLLSRS